MRRLILYLPNFPEYLYSYTNKYYQNNKKEGNPELSKIIILRVFSQKQIKYSQTISEGTGKKL